MRQQAKGRNPARWKLGYARSYTGSGEVMEATAAADSDGGARLPLSKSEQRRLLKQSKREAAMRTEMLSKLQVIGLRSALCTLFCARV